MKTLVIYDNTGYIILTFNAPYRVPEGGINYLEVEIPVGQRVTSIDTTKAPNVPNFEDIPKTDIEKLQEQVASLTQANAELTSIVATMET
ncbi:hypothetical protein, partial [Clostridium beijerinckii]